MCNTDDKMISHFSHIIRTITVQSVAADVPLIGFVFFLLIKS